MKLQVTTQIYDYLTDAIALFEEHKTKLKPNEKAFINKFLYSLDDQFKGSGSVTIKQLCVFDRVRDQLFDAAKTPSFKETLQLVEEKMLF
jgi:hypothetical protein